MNTMPFNIFIISSIVEAVLVIYCGLILLGMKPDFKRVAAAGILLGVVIYYITGEMHLDINRLILYYMFILFLYIIATYFIVKVPLMIAILSNLLGMVIVLLVHGPVTLLAPAFTGLTFMEMMSRDWIRLTCSLPKLTILTCIIFMCRKYNFTLEEEMKFLKKSNSGVNDQDCCFNRKNA